MHILNISAYQFVPLPDAAELRPALKEAAVAAGLKGTILLAPEGINLFLAGAPEPVRGFVAGLARDARFAALPIKESWSDHQPFNRMLVKLKKEIITMRHPTIRPAGRRAESVEPRRLKAWLDQGHDDQGRPVVLLDTRNGYEVELGSFDGALELGLKHFVDFPAAVQARREALAGKTVVSFCTGGIRCEKAALYMQELGMERVLQLDGGILRYFEEVGGAHWHGDCFVFDKRVALSPSLQETDTTQCYACRAVVTREERRSPLYVEGRQCPRCAERQAA
jgi:UPF0176 protein